MKLIKQYFWVGLVALFVAMDQFSKYVINQTIPINQSSELIPGFFSLQHVRNEGAAMGILDGQRWIFMTFTVVIIVAAVLFLLSGKVKNRWGILSISMIIGGGIGNMIDRVFLGEVIDFFAFNFWGFEFWIFNVADIFVTCGTFLLALYILLSSDFDSKKDVNEDIEEIEGKNEEI